MKQSPQYSISKYILGFDQEGNAVVKMIVVVRVWSGLRVQWPSESEHWSRSGSGLGQSEASLRAVQPMRGKLISLTPGWRILVQSRHGWVESERTVMRTLVIHWDVLGPLLGLCHCHSLSSRDQHHDKMTLSHPDHHHPNIQIIIKFGWRFSKIWKKL